MKTDKYLSYRTPDYIIKTFANLNVNFSDLNLQRVITIALPFLALHSKTAPYTAVGAGLYQCYTLWSTYDSKMTTGNKFTETALLASSTVLGYLFPTAQLAISSVACFINQCPQLIKQDSSWQERCDALLKISHQTVHLMSSRYQTPVCTVLALLLQATEEFTQAVQHYKDGDKTPEMAASILLASIRLYQVSNHIPQSTVKDVAKETQAATSTPNAPSDPAAQAPASPEPISPPVDPQEMSSTPKKMTTEAWKALSEKYEFSQRRSEEAPKLHLYTLLKAEGFATHLEDIDFSQSVYAHINFADVSFQRCNFSKVTFFNFRFCNCRMTNCNFKGAIFDKAEVFDSSFISCDLSFTELKQSLSRRQNTFQGCILEPGIFSLELQQSTPADTATHTPADTATHQGETLQEATSQQPLKKLTQKDLDRFLQQSSGGGGPYDFATRLRQAGFSSELEGLTLYDSDFAKCTFKNILFKECQFKKVNFSDCHFDRVTVENCDFRKSLWQDSRIQNSAFTDCDFYKAEFENLQMDGVKALNSLFRKSSFFSADVKNTLFTSCDFSYSSTWKSSYEKTMFAKSLFWRSNWTSSSIDQITFQEGYLSESSFLHTSVRDSHLIDCDLKDALLLDAKQGFLIQGGTPHQITKPIVALGWYFEGSGHYTCLVQKALRDNGALVLPYEQSGFKESLASEFTDALKKISSSEQNPSQLSIGQQLVQNAPAGSEIGQINQKAKEILKYANGLIIPGGGDVEPTVYNSSIQPSGYSDPRTVLELALLSEAHQQKIPTMGICRGAQMINVFFGGTLVTVGHQGGFHSLEWVNTPHAEPLRKILPEEFRAESMHHQAVNRVGAGLHTVLKQGNVPKVLLSEDGNFIASQVHPESYVSALKLLVPKLKLDGKSYTEGDLGLVKKINTELSQKIQEMRDQQKNSPLAEQYLEELDQKLLEHDEQVDLVAPNKNLYRFFMEKVEKRRIHGASEEQTTTTKL
jgi:gamma-glutamyl-gamma-aminobutyrate hydrolase PuuD